MSKHPISAEHIKKRLSTLQSERSEMESLYTEVQRYILDRTTQMHPTSSSKGNRSRRNYDKTGVYLNLRFAAALQGFVAPAEQRWFSLETPTPTQDLSYDARLYLDALEETLYQLFNSSNFYQQSLEMITDYTSFGRGTMLVVPCKKRKLKFITIPMRETYIDTDFDNRINTVCRLFLKSNRAIKHEFNVDDTQNEAFNKACEQSPDDEVEVLHYVAPNPNYVPDSTNVNKKEYVSIYVYNGNSPFILRKSFYNSFPYMTPRWNVYPGEKEGRSQAMLAVSDVRVMSLINNNVLGSLQVTLDPPRLVHSGSVAGAALNLAPGANIPIKEPLGGRIDQAIVPLQLNTRPDIGLNALEYYRQKVEKMFFADIIAEDKNAEMSATEASTRQMLRIANMAPQIGRLIPEYLQPLFPRMIEILLEGGHIPPVPQELEDMAIEFRSPLAKAQKMQSMEGITQFGQFLQQWASIDPSIMSTVKPDVIVQQAAIATDIPTRILKSPDELEQERQQQAEQAQQQQQLEAAQILAQSQNQLAGAAQKLS